MAMAAASRSMRTALLAARAALRAPADVRRVAGGRTSALAVLSAFAAPRDAAAGIRSYARWSREPFRGYGVPSCYKPDEEQLAFHYAEYEDGLLDHGKYLFEGDDWPGDRPWCGPIGEDGLPTWVDWRLRGAVTPVQDQLVTGPCWAFAALGAMEVEHFLATGGDLVKLSEQHLLDGNDVNNDGFTGGLVPEAYHYILREQHGISLAKDYPYVGKPMPFKEEKANLVTITSYCPAIEEFALKKAVSKSAVAAGILISSKWMEYSGGIIRGPSASPYETDHTVTVVAYGSSRQNEEFWQVWPLWRIPVSCPWVIP